MNVLNGHNLLKIEHSSSNSSYYYDWITPLNPYEKYFSVVRDAMYLHVRVMSDEITGDLNTHRRAKGGHHRWSF